MGCFLAPVAEAIVVTVAATIVKKQENKKLDNSQELEKEEAHKVSSRLFRLTSLLYGGAILLLFEHIWHGEIVPWFPFFTAVESGEVPEMMAEIGTTGVFMAILCTLAWGVAEGLRYVFGKNKAKEKVTE